MYYNGDQEIINTINKYEDYIAKETLSTKIIQKENLEETLDINGHSMTIEIIVTN